MAMAMNDTAPIQIQMGPSRGQWLARVIVTTEAREIRKQIEAPSFWVCMQRIQQHISEQVNTTVSMPSPKLEGN